MKIRPAYVRQLAAELEMLAHGSTTSWNPAGGNGIPSSRVPSGESQPPHLQFLAEWDKRGDACLSKWHSVLTDWRGRKTHTTTGKTDREIVLEAGEGHKADDVAQRYRLTATTVRKWRLEDGRNVDTGRKVNVRGCTQQEEAEAFGVSQPTIHRMRRKAA